MNLRALSMFLSASWPPADWAELSGLYPEVAHLRVDDNGAVSLVSAMGENVTLGFRGVDMNQEALCDSVPELLRAGKPVERLEMAACSAQFVIDDFVNLIDDVAWSLNEVANSDSDS